jgi:glycosyltransferase involved in cell wall biosynthesis
MQIAQIAPLTEAIPPKLYGGTERVISWLTDELVALGHEVVLFASGDSQTSAHLEACWPGALRLDGSVRDPNALHVAMLERVCQRARDFDLLHVHLDYYPFSLFSRQPTPFVSTLHGRLDLPEHQVVFATFSSIPVISISDAQRRPVPNAGWIRTIHHGLFGGALRSGLPPSGWRANILPSIAASSNLKYCAHEGRWRGHRSADGPNALRVMNIKRTADGAAASEDPDGVVSGRERVLGCRKRRAGRTFRPTPS